MIIQSDTNKRKRIVSFSFRFFKLVHIQKVFSLVRLMLQQFHKGLREG